MKIRWWLGVVAAMSAAGCAGSGELTRHSLSPQIAQAATDVRIVSLNLRRPVLTDGPDYWEHRKHNLTATLRYLNPDLVATQECMSDQAAFIERGLPGYQRVGAGREDGRDGGEMCAIFFDARRFSLLDSGHFWLSDQPARPGTSFDGEWWPRMVTWARLHDRAADRALVLFNTHLPVMSESAREQSAALLRDRIARIAGTDPVLLAGDFNDGDDSPTYRLLTAQTPLRDTYRAIHPQPAEHEGTRHEFHSRLTGDRMDWILASDDFLTRQADIQRHSVTGRPVSDHYPVTATLRWAADPSLALQPTPPSAPARP